MVKLIRSYFLTGKFCCLLILLILLSFSSQLFSQNLNPGDKIKLTVYNVSDVLSEEYFIQEDGTIHLPYIGVVNTKDNPSWKIRTEIRERYRVLYQELELHIQLLYKVNILGEVNNPGIYYVTGAERISDVLAIAGGETRDANMKKIILVRNNSSRTINGKKILEKGKQISDIQLQSGDKIYVKKKFINSRSLTVTISALALLLATYSTFYK
jgi:polysaccharide export outer membrane protein